MKNPVVKITAIVLLIIQLALSIKAIVILKPFFDKIPNEGGMIQLQKMLIFTAFVFALIIIIALIVVVFSLLEQKNKEKNNIIVPEKDNLKDLKKDKVNTKAKLLEVGKDKRETVENLLIGLESEKNRKEFFDKLLKNISTKYDIVQGIVFLKDKKDKKYKKEATYAFYKEEEARDFEEEIGISGQVAANRELLNISELPDKYLTVLSGLGSSSPNHLIIFPILFKNKSIGIIEIATFKKIDKHNEEILMNFSEILGDLTENFR